MDVMLKAGKYMKKVNIEPDGKRLVLKFGYNEKLLEEVKSMEGARWHGHDEVNPRKVWSIVNSARNRFQIQYLAHPDPKDPQCPYYLYDQEMVPFEPAPRDCPRCRGLSGKSDCRICYGKGVVRPYTHQIVMARLWLSVQQCMWASEMGTGKTLAALMAMEQIGELECIWVAPKSALNSAQLEFSDWKAKIWPKFYTYDGLKKLVETWPEGKAPPKLVVFDESSRLKNPTAQRTQAARYLCEQMRLAYKRPYILEMSGSPAPKAPTDWHSQCEIAQPGYLKEGNIQKFKSRLAIIKQEESVAGGVYPRLVTWKDDVRKCNQCGAFKEAPQHDVKYMVDGSDYHPFMPSIDEISLLYQRMKGLVQVVFKKDVLELPDKIYKIIDLKPNQSIFNAARAIEASASTTIQALTLLRELSDGFQYQQEEKGTKQCPECKGTRISEEYFDADDPECMPTPEEFERGRRILYTEDGIVEGKELRLEKRVISCPHCSGTGEVSAYERIAVQVPCPKEDALYDILDEHEDVGRLVTFAGFTGSVERCVEISTKAGWQVVRVDGRGWHSSVPGDSLEMYRIFQRELEKYPKINFVAQAGSGGMGLNLTASPSIVYYSNDFNAENRIQSEDRCHRPGMDLNKGCTIIDLCHLPSDYYVLDNLRKKRRLQDLSLGQFREAVANTVSGFKIGDIR